MLGLNSGDGVGNLDLPLYCVQWLGSSYVRYDMKRECTARYYNYVCFMKVVEYSLQRNIGC